MSIDWKMCDKQNNFTPIYVPCYKVCLTKQSGGWGPWGLIWTHSHSLQSSISAFSTDLKEFKHFGADKTFTTRCSGSRVQVWVQVSPCLLSGNHSRRLYQKTIRWSKVLTTKSKAKLLGQRSGTAWADWTCKHKHRIFPSLQQSLLAATSLLEKNMLNAL